MGLQGQTRGPDTCTHTDCRVHQQADRDRHHSHEGNGTRRTEEGEGIGVDFENFQRFRFGKKWIKPLKGVEGQKQPQSWKEVRKVCRHGAKPETRPCGHQQSQFPLRGQVQRRPWGRSLVAFTRGLWCSHRGRSQVYELKIIRYHKDQVRRCTGCPGKAIRGYAEDLACGW